MSSTATPTKPFEPGTTGWTAGDLDDPRIEAEWMRGSYEIVEGVLTTMPPAYFTGGKSLYTLMYKVTTHQKQLGVDGDFSIEVDIVVDEDRVAKADAVWMTPAEQQRQAEAAKAAGRRSPERTRILVPPSLIIESVSPGHEAHDRRVKRRWYAELGVPHYWIIDGYEKSLECLVLRQGQYDVDSAGRAEEVVQPSFLPDLKIELGELWGR